LYLADWVAIKPKFDTITLVSGRRIMNTFFGQLAVFLILSTVASEAAAQQTGSIRPNQQQPKQNPKQQPGSGSGKTTGEGQNKPQATSSLPSGTNDQKPPAAAGTRNGTRIPKSGANGPNGIINQNRKGNQSSGNVRSGNSLPTNPGSAGSAQTPGSEKTNSGTGQSVTGNPLSRRPNSSTRPTSENRQGGVLPRNPSNNSLGSAQISRNSSGNKAPSTPPVPPAVAPISGGAPTGNSTTRQRTVVEVLGEEGFKESGLPIEARTMPVDQAVALGQQIAVQEHFGLPKEATRGMTAEQLSEEVGKLQAFGALDQIQNERFWKTHQQRGFDVAIAPHVRDNLGIPIGVHAESPASRIFEDAGEMQNFGLDITDGQHWGLFEEYRGGKKSAQDLIDAANGSNGGRSNGTGSRNEQNNEGAGSGNGAGANGGRSNQPGNSSSDLPGAGPGGRGAASFDTNPPGSQTQQAESGSSTGVDMEGDTFEAVDPASQYSAVVTHNDDGSFTVDIYQDDGAGTTTKVNSENYSDSDGDGNYSGDKGGSSSGKPAEGSASVAEDEDGTYVWAGNSESSTNSSSSESDSADTDADTDTDTDTDTKPTDKYTPGPDGEVYYDFAWMLAAYQSLSTEKFRAGKGDKDSTPNPMNESFGGGRRLWNPKDSVVRPVDGTSSSSGVIPNEALQQIQDPNAVQGGVIDPAKRKDQ
jgi:hypothetical protein